ncbi:MAG TPA: hypothetical protein VH641_08970 [Streptosporangiaceae bacterium]|jgi:hypothetical protein
MSDAGYESWFVSARDPAARRALWIRHTRHRPRGGPDSRALWCTVADPALGPRPAVVKQVFHTFPASTLAGRDQFRGEAVLADRAARWDLDISSWQAPLRPLRPAWLYRAAVPRTKLEATVPDGIATGAVEVGGQQVEVSGWRATVGHNWGAGHADTWVWLHAAGFGAAPDGWLELVLARIKVGPERSPWTAMGALSLGGEPLWLGGLGRRPAVDAAPGRLTTTVPSPRAQLRVTVTTEDADAVAVAYADPSGGTRAVRHAALATVELSLRRAGAAEFSLATDRGAYEFGASGQLPGVALESLPEG